jgi:hypothetical protein
MPAIFRFVIPFVFPTVAACGGGAPDVSGVDADDDPAGADGRPGTPDARQPGHADAAVPPPDGPPAGCVWNPTLISTSMWTAKSNLALAVAPSGERAVIFTAATEILHRDLFVARNPAGTYTVTPYGLALYDWGDYEHVAGAFTPGGALRVAYGHRNSNDANDRKLHVSTGPGATVMIDDGGPFGYADYPAVAVGADGATRVAYYVHNIFGVDDRIVVATASGAGFSLEEAIVRPQLWGQTLLAVDSAGSAHVASICDPDDAHLGMTYAKRTTSGWTEPSTVLVPDGVRGGASLGMTPGGAAHAVVVGGSSLTDITGGPGAWSMATIPYAAHAIDPYALLLYTQVDASGAIHATWGDEAGTLWYERVGAARAPILATGQRIRDAAIALGPDGPVVAFAVGSPDSWSTPVQIYVASCD